MKTFEYAFQERKDLELSAEQIAEMPYTAMYGQIDGAPRTLVVLGFADRTTDVSRLSWVTGGRQSVSTEYARIVSTSGLDRNMVAVSDITEDPLRCIVRAPQQCSTQWIRQIDFKGKEGAPEHSGTETLISDFTRHGPETFTLPDGRELLVYRVEEQGRFVFARQRFTNMFWIEPDGHVVKSRQVMMPNTRAIELTQVKWQGRN